MNTRGFTLIELTAVIVVLAAIFLVSFPTFLDTSRADKEKEYENMVNNLCMAGRTYIYANMDGFDELSTIGSTIKVNVSDLIEYGNVDKNTINVKTEKKVEKDLLIYTVLNDYSLECEYND